MCSDPVSGNIWWSWRALWKVTAPVTTVDTLLEQSTVAELKQDWQETVQEYFLSAQRLNSRRPQIFQPLSTEYLWDIWCPCWNILKSISPRVGSQQLLPNSSCLLRNDTLNLAFHTHGGKEGNNPLKSLLISAQGEKREAFSFSNAPWPCTATA